MPLVTLETSYHVFTIKLSQTDNALVIKHFSSFELLFPFSKKASVKWGSLSRNSVSDVVHLHAVEAPKTENEGSGGQNNAQGDRVNPAKYEADHAYDIPLHLFSVP